MTGTAVVKHAIITHLIILAIVHVAQVSDVAPVSLVNVFLLISNYSNVTM